MSSEKKTKSDALPIAGDKVDGRSVNRGPVPNMSSIESSLSQYEIIQEVRDVSIDLFTYTHPYSSSELRKTERLAKEIQESNSITPLIVVEDIQGFYILEGGHRFDALCMLGAKSFPAVVVKDLDSLKDFV